MKGNLTIVAHSILVQGKNGGESLGKARLLRDTSAARGKAGSTDNDARDLAIASPQYDKDKRRNISC